jgi:hypothetical protein
MKEIAMIVLAVSVVATLGLSGAWFHLSDYWQVRAELSDLVGAQATGVRAEPDLRLERIRATIRLEDGSEVDLSGLTPASVNATGVIGIEEMGGWRVASRGCDCTLAQVNAATGQRQCMMYIGRTFEIGKGGKLGGLVPFPIRNVQDMVDHYDEIASVLESLPAYPQVGHLVAENGSELYYQRYPSDLELSDLADSVFRDDALRFVAAGCSR